MILKQSKTKVSRKIIIINSDKIGPIPNKLIQLFSDKAKKLLSEQSV